MLKPTAIILLTGGLALGTGGLQAQQNRENTARRVASVASLALSEYSEGLVDGQVVSQEELHEAELFVESALEAASEIPDTSGSIRRELSAMRDLMVDRADPSLVSERLAVLLDVLSQVAGVPLDPKPQSVPSLARGERLFERNCASCHGTGGEGTGPAAARLSPPPSDLTDSEGLSGATPLEFFRKIEVGVAGTAMPAFDDILTEAERWDLALYSSLLRYRAGIWDEGRTDLEDTCSRCVLEFSDFGTTSALSDDSLAALISAWSGTSLSRSELTPMVAFARVAGSGDQRGNDLKARAALTALRVEERVDQAVTAFERGDAGLAAQAATEAYLAFEAIESSVRARDPAAAASAERAFSEFRIALESGRGVETRREVLEAAVKTSIAALEINSSPSILFGQSLVIILREGLEAILIVGALAAFLSKVGASERRKDLGWGVVAALAASLLTAAMFSGLISSAASSRELLEGLTMLVAAAVLFWVSYWLVSKIEIQKWQRFVAEQMKKALSSRRSWALAAVAFLAVFREGFETVLFYSALFLSAEGNVAGLSAIIAGLVLGLVGLAIVYYAIHRYGVRLPLKPMFAVTSAFLYAMAFSFAGQGVAELQEAGYVNVTPLRWLPRIPALGIFPTTETALTQSFLAVALAGALVWVFLVAPRRSVVPVSGR